VAVGSQEHLALGACHQRHILCRVARRLARPYRSDSGSCSYLPSASSRHIGMSIADVLRPPSQLRRLAVRSRSGMLSVSGLPSGRAAAREGGVPTDRKGVAG
jgi:hypothetical protein